MDVHKKMRAVVIADVAVEGEYRSERQNFGATPTELQRSAPRRNARAWRK